MRRPLSADARGGSHNNQPRQEQQQHPQPKLLRIIFVESVLVEFVLGKSFLGENFLGENFLGEKFLGEFVLVGFAPVKPAARLLWESCRARFPGVFFLGENFLGENFFGECALGETVPVKKKICTACFLRGKLSRRKLSRRKVSRRIGSRRICSRRICVGRPAGPPTGGVSRLAGPPLPSGVQVSRSARHRLMCVAAWLVGWRQ